MRPARNCTSDCNLRSGSSGPALHTGKNTPGITGGCGQTKNVTEPLLQFRGDPRKPWIKREVFIEGCQTVAGPMYSIGIIGAPAKTICREIKLKLGSPQVTL